MKKWQLFLTVVSFMAVMVGHSPKGVHGQDPFEASLDRITIDAIIPLGPEESAEIYVKKSKGEPTNSEGAVDLNTQLECEIQFTDRYGTLLPRSTCEFNLPNDKIIASCPFNPTRQSEERQVYAMSMMCKGDSRTTRGNLVTPLTIAIATVSPASTTVGYLPNGQWLPNGSGANPLPPP